MGNFSIQLPFNGPGISDCLLPTLPYFQKWSWLLWLQRFVIFEMKRITNPLGKQDRVLNKTSFQQTYDRFLACLGGWAESEPSLPTINDLLISTALQRIIFKSVPIVTKVVTLVKKISANFVNGWFHF